MALYPYRKSKQIRTYISQFSRVFAGFQTKDNTETDGTDNLRRVPVVYGDMSRVVATILNKRDHRYRGEMPIMATNMVGIQPDLDENRSYVHEDTAITPDRQETATRLIGPAFIMNMELSILASSTEELLDLLENILLIFNPRVTLQVDPNVYNSDCITNITLTGIQPEFNYPMADSTKVVALTLTFDVPIRLRYPYSVADRGITEIALELINEPTNETLFLDIIPEEEI